MLRTSATYGNFGKNLHQKLSELFERPCRIMYVGASVTAQQNTYFLDFHDRLSKLTGHSHSLERIAIGGTGSIVSYHTYLQKSRLDAEQPTLVFFECFTGDLNGLVPGRIAIAVIGALAQRVRAGGGEMIIINGYRADKPLDSPLHEAYATAAATFNVPYINMRPTNIGEGEWGSFVASKIFRDQVHTTDAGSVLLSSFLISTLFDFQAAEEADQQPHASDVDIDLMSQLQLQLMELELDIQNEVVPNDQITTKPNGDIYPAIVVGKNGRIRFKYDGFLCQLVFVGGPDSSLVDLSLLGMNYKMNVFDRNCYYRRLKTNSVYKNLKGDIVEMSVSADPIDIESIPADKRHLILEQKHIRFIGALGVPNLYWKGGLNLDA